MGLTKSRFIPEYGKPELQNDDHQFNDETTENSKIESRSLTRNHMPCVAFDRYKSVHDYLNQLLKSRRMKIKAETLECQTVTLWNVSSLDLVRDVKDKIATRLRRKNQDEIILLHKQEEMKDFEKLESYGITDGSTIYVIPRIRGKDYLIPNETNENSRIESRSLTRNHMPCEAIYRHNIYDDYINYLKSKLMTINAETLEGETVTVTNVSRLDLVRDVKDKVATRLRRMNLDEIILLHQQEEMKDFNTLESYGITDGSTINVIPRIPGKGIYEHANFAYDQVKDKVKRLGYVYKGHSFGAKFDRALAMMYMTLATLHMALDMRPLHRGVQNMWKLYKGISEIATIALNQAKGMLTCLGVQNIRQLCKDLMGNATFILDKAKLIFKSLVDWFPCLLKDSSQVLTEQNLVKIAQGIGKGWKILGLSLGLDRVQLDHITEDHKSTVMKIYTMLTTWLDENGSEATVGTLYQTMSDCKGVRFNWNTITSVLSDVCQSAI